MKPHTEPDMKPVPEPFEPRAVAHYLSTWIGEQAREAGVRGTVVGLSGGVDSAVVAALCQRACPGHAYALIMPCESNRLDVEHAQAVARAVGISSVTIELDAAYRALCQSLPTAGAPPLAMANLKPRLRMITLYFFANTHKLLVVGTGNRSEIHVGYFTKYGDAGVDILPLAGLVKEQVRALAYHLGIPREVIEKPPTAGLWPGQTDEGEMGLSYADLDHYLLTGEATPQVRTRIEAMHRASEHKRRLPNQPPGEFRAR